SSRTRWGSASSRTIRWRARSATTSAAPTRPSPPPPNAWCSWPPEFPSSSKARCRASAAGSLASVRFRRAYPGSQNRTSDEIGQGVLVSATSRRFRVCRKELGKGWRDQGRLLELGPASVDDLAVGWSVHADGEKVVVRVNGEHEREMAIPEMARLLLPFGIVAFQRQQLELVPAKALRARSPEIRTAQEPDVLGRVGARVERLEEVRNLDRHARVTALHLVRKQGFAGGAAADLPAARSEFLENVGA